MSQYEYDAVFLASYGGPEGQEEVIPFLRNVTRGKNIPDERLEEVAHHYRHFGGVSPINQQNRELQQALIEALAAEGIDIPVYHGNRNSEPYTEKAMLEATQAGHTKLLGLITSAYTSYSGVEQYLEDFERGLAQEGIPADTMVTKIREYFDHPGFIAPFVEGVQQGWESLKAEHPDLELGVNAKILFCTHSIPHTMAERSGPEFGEGGAYVAQHLAVAEVIMTKAFGPQSNVPANWSLSYQSRSGPPSQPWLEPDINEVIEALPAQGIKAVLIVPIGFVSDHMEVAWDLDTEALETAAEVGITASRVLTPGTHPAFVAGLVDLIKEKLFNKPVSERLHETELGPWPELPPLTVVRGE